MSTNKNPDPLIDPDYFTPVEICNAVGPCPKCGGKNWDLQVKMIDSKTAEMDKEMRAYCEGTKDAPHPVVVKNVPVPYNPTLKPFGRSAKK